MADPIAAFWTWWKTAAPRIVEAMEARDLPEIEVEMAPDPTWEGLERWS